MIYPVNKMTAEQIAYATGGEIIYGDSSSVITSVSTDSRTVEAGTLYVPIKGERFDGHDFIDAACETGGVGYLCSDGHINPNSGFVIKTGDTRKAFLDLASYYRDRFDIKLVGLTGSVGKTTTKEFLASVVSQKFNTLYTKGNFNNDIGVPITLFGLRDENEAAVIEMGMSNFGEIEVLSRCAKPDIAVITNIGTSHIEFLKSREGILKAKCEILKGLKSRGRVVLNGDDPYLWSLRGNIDFDIIYIGVENSECDYIAHDIYGDENGSRFACNGKNYCINLAGGHNIYNALTAIAVGELMGLDYEQISAGLADYHTDGIRQNIIAVNGYKVINDCYNASPQSVIAELDVLDSVEAVRRIAVLGDMAELGELSDELHAQVGKAVAQKNTDVLICAGNLAKGIARAAVGVESYCFDTSKEAAEFVKDFVRTGDAVLIKASRCMHFENISEKII